MNTMRTIQDPEGPDYKGNRKLYLFSVVRKYTFIAAILLLVIAGVGSNGTYHRLGIISLLVLNVTGVYIGWLLIQKQQHIPNDHADKICSMLKRSSCNSVLASSAAKIMGVIGWSEIGVSYFISNTLIVVLAPHLIPYLALINIAGLPYSFWSVWYQKFKVKEWCPLCLIVQILLWMVFVVDLIFVCVVIPPFAVLDIVLTGCIYLVPLLIINTLLPKLNKGKYTEHLEKEMRHLRLNPEVFKALLHQQLHCEVDFSASSILWGNKDANLIVTIVTNPHCYHCSTMHRRVKQLLVGINDKICVQYIFHASKEEYESSSVFLISAYLSDEISEIEKKEIYDHWFEEGRNNKEEFFEKYHLNTDQKVVQAELQSHKQWKGLKEINGTPTVFINGYELPRQYQIEDLIHFPDLKI